MPGWRNGRRKGLKKLSLQEETPEVDALKFGETLAGNADGNPEPSPDPEKGRGRCRDFTGAHLSRRCRYGEEKVQRTKAKAMCDENPLSVRVCGFDSRPGHQNIVTALADPRNTSHQMRIALSGRSFLTFRRPTRQAQRLCFREKHPKPEALC